MLSSAGGGGDVRPPRQEPGHGQYVQRQGKIPRGVRSQGGIGVWDKGPDSQHVRIDLPNQDQIVGQHFHGLPGKPHHVSRADFVPQLSQCPEARDAVGEEAPRTKPAVELRRGGFVFEEVSPGPRVPEGSIGVRAPLPDREGDDKAGGLPNRGDQAAELLRGKEGVSPDWRTTVPTPALRISSAAARISSSVIR